MAKILEWTKPAPPNNDCPYDHCSAETPFGPYQIEWKSWKDYPGYSVEFCGELVTVENRLDDAQASAQADFDLRIIQSSSDPQ